MKAFVIMPYGGDDPGLIKEYNRIFRFLISEAISLYDPNIEVIRQDHSGEGGQILRNVITNIAESDLVIADLSNANWNVAYELGMRHVMNKYGTVLICNDRTELPYDVKFLNVIMYPADSWLDHVEELTDTISRNIAKSMSRERSDSPVFDIFAALPPNLTAMLSNTNDEEQKRMMQMSKDLQEANEEITRLRQRIESLGLDAAQSEEKQSVDFRSLFRTAINNRVYNSDAAVAKLRELADAKDYEGFSEFLAQVLENGYLDETDCRNVYILCRRLSVPEISRIFLETVVEYYPENEELRAFLANEYSQDYHNRDKALTLVNESVGIRRREGRYEAVPKVRSDRLLRTMFDVYIHLRKYPEIIAISQVLLRAAPRHQTLIYRNMCVAAIRTEDMDLAKQCLDILLEQAPREDRTYYSCYQYYDALGDQISAYKALEKCIACDPDDEDYYTLMAGQICDERVARTPEGGVCRIEPGEREKYAVPFLLRLLTRNPSQTLQKVQTFLKRNSFTETLNRLNGFLRDQLDQEAFFGAYDFSAVDYCSSSLLEP
jgi:tetratricopeptide (TPR) repeat protein